MRRPSGRHAKVHGTRLGCVSIGIPPHRPQVLFRNVRIRGVRHESDGDTIRDQGSLPDRATLSVETGLPDRPLPSTSCRSACRATALQSETDPEADGPDGLARRIVGAGIVDEAKAGHVREGSSRGLVRHDRAAPREVREDASDPGCSRARPGRFRTAQFCRMGCPPARPSHSRAAAAELTLRLSARERAPDRAAGERPAQLAAVNWSRASAAR